MPGRVWPIMLRYRSVPFLLRRRLREGETMLNYKSALIGACAVVALAAAPIAPASAHDHDFRHGGLIFGLAAATGAVVAGVATIVTAPVRALAAPVYAPAPAYYAPPPAAYYPPPTAYYPPGYYAP